MNKENVSAYFSLFFIGVMTGLFIMGGAIKYDKNTTPSITHDTVYVLINTDTLYDNAVTGDAIDSSINNCISTIE
jgi:hypothetical protein